MKITDINKWRELVSTQLKSMAEALELMHIEIIKLKEQNKK